MKSEKPLSIANISIALIYDEPKKLIRSTEQPFPPEAEAEWETQETINKIADAWTRNGCRVIKLPLDKFFLSRWASEHHAIELVHTVVEGWGAPAREAWIPALCELSGIPYIGSDPFAQCVSMKKSTFKILCRALGVPTSDFHLVLTEEDIQQIPESLLNRPHFLKPDCEGSGMGIDATHSVGSSPASSRLACKQLLNDFPDGVLIEELLPGRELTSAFIGCDPATLLPIAEIEVPDGVYGLSNKSKEAMEEKITFPELTNEMRQTIQSSMLTLQKQIGFEDFVRFDWKLNSSGRPMLLEANPLAGLSYYYSVLPKMAEAAGLSYETLLKKIALSALSRRNHRKFWYGRARINSKTAEMND